MLDVRMLFSTLVDADFIETEAHFNALDDKNKGYRREGPPLEPERALGILTDHLKILQASSKASENVISIRNDLLQACLDAASFSKGLFTLTAPTGAGKTFSMLAFALKHAKKHGLRRIVVVIPYLSIIEQTVSEYRKVFDNDFEKEYVLEHHSLAGIHGNDDAEDYFESRQRLLSENWDAPIIVTTSVQFLESLFANRPSACRKLHRLAKSVILFDEVQTLPTGIAVPTLATLSRLAERYNTSVVFSTATQPAFTHLNDTVRKFCVCGWEPREIVPEDLKLFKRAKRTRVEWPDLERRISWDELAKTLKTHKQTLCIVNLKRHALSLFQDLLDLGCKEGELFHLSTNMCPAHRKVVLDEVRQRLIDGNPCRLISTQCVEAGVDVDFPVVFRAWGPLDSIAQAAGRCNRNGRADFGTVHVFLPEGDDYPDGSYRQAAGITRILKAQGRMDIHDPKLFFKYYRELYDLVKPENRREDLINALKRQDFAETAKLFRVIEKEAINVLVPYAVDEFERLEEEVRTNGLTRGWISRARPYTIGFYRPNQNDPVREWLVPIKANEKTSDDWFIYLNKEHYNPKTGLVPTTLDCLIA
jgi:CRISPR-associated helicase Cas3